MGSGPPHTHVLGFYIDGDYDPLPDLQTRLQLILWCHHQLWAPILHHFRGTQHPLDLTHCLAAPAPQPQSQECDRIPVWDHSGLQDNRHNAHREFCPLRRRVDMLHRPLRHVAPRVCRFPPDAVTSADHRPIAHHPSCGGSTSLDWIERSWGNVSEPLSGPVQEY